MQIMKKLLFILTLVLAALLPVELWAQSTTGGDDGSDAVAAPTFRFDGDYLVIKTVTEDASIFYQMADLPDMSDETIEKISSSMTVTPDVSQSMYYEQPILLQKSVVLKAIAAGATNSEVSTLIYDYDAWNGLLEAIEYGWHVQELAKDNANVDADLKEELQWALDESKHIFDERATIPYQEAQHFANQIYDICDKIEEQMSGQATAEPYAVLSENNTVLTFYYDEKKNERNGMGVGPFELVYVDGQPTANSDWFSQREKITEVVFDESFANVTTLTSTALWFYKCEKLTKISGIHYLYTANVTDMNHMFGGCRLLTDLDLSNFNTANVKNLDGMFSEAGFTNLDLSSFDTSNVTDMYGLFWGTTGLKNVDLSSFNTSSVTTMRGMFNYCWNLTNIDLSNFDTSNATDIAVMFNECSGLTSLDLSNFKTDNVEEMTYMFRGCSHLTNVDLSSFNTGNVTYMINMFEGCTSLTTLDLSSFNTAKLRYVSQMFKGCSALNTIYVGSEWTTNNIETSNEMFSGCTNLIGGKGTHYNANHTDYTYAHIDGGPSNPGYFTAKDAPVIDATFDSNGVLTIGSGTTMTDALESVGGRAEVAKTITAIVWNNETELTDDDLQGLDNPNMLIYVTNESLAPQNRNNIITYDFAKNIVLTDVTEGNGNFYCPQEFKAETITYSHEYNQTTEIDVARGWESIALPFAVQTITHETKGLIAPFGNDAINKHFWLRQLTENGLARATEIEPNTAYLISMPNNDAYYADFNLNGLVTFSSVDVWVPKTQIHAVDYHTEKGMVVLLPNFQRRASDYTTYALNVGEQRGDYPEGSVFEREYRDIRPFEAYTFHQGGSAPRFLPISDLNGDDATGIEEVRSLRAEGRGDVWYDLSGRRLQQKPAGKGVYILNGRKVVIK